MSWKTKITTCCFWVRAYVWWVCQESTQWVWEPLEKKKKQFCFSSANPERVPQNISVSVLTSVSFVVHPLLYCNNEHGLMLKIIHPDTRKYYWTNVLKGYETCIYNGSPMNPVILHIKFNWLHYNTAEGSVIDRCMVMFYEDAWWCFMRMQLYVSLSAMLSHTFVCAITVEDGIFPHSSMCCSVFLCNCRTEAKDNRISSPLWTSLMSDISDLSQTQVFLVFFLDSTNYSPLDWPNCTVKLRVIGNQSQLSQPNFTWWEPCPLKSELWDWGVKIRWELIGTQTLLMLANRAISKTIKGYYARLLDRRPDLIRVFTSAWAFVPEDLKSKAIIFLLLFYLSLSKSLIGARGGQNVFFYAIMAPVLVSNNIFYPSYVYKKSSVLKECHIKLKNLFLYCKDRL